MLAEFINQNSGAKFIIAPHEVSEGNINRLTQLLKKPTVLFSRINENNVDKQQVIVIDSIGLLSSLYRYANLAYIGGGFGVGIHNILEAATFGLPVIFGPNYQKFKEAVDLTAEGGAFPVSNYSMLETIMNTMLNQRNTLEKAAEISRNYVVKNVGATTLIIKKVFNQ
jgi:3-deoxy-D-manno-octulosonic-acid transferase